MPTTFAKVHSGGCDYIVVNKAQSTADDLPAMARRYCPQRAGVGAAGLAIFAHQGRARFVARYFDRDGTESPAEDSALRSCARVINLQYGYQAATLITAGTMYESRTSGDQVGLRFLGDASLRIRTFDWEAGPETISSGPAALTAAVVANRLGLRGRDRIEVQTRSGCSLAVQADGDRGTGQWLYGPAVFTFSGELPCLFESAADPPPPSRSLGRPSR
jgi:diaminopimelate epimerase